MDYYVELFLKIPLTHSFPMHPFPTPWKHQKTLWFTDVFRGWRKCALGTNSLTLEWSLKFSLPTFVFIGIEISDATTMAVLVTLSVALLLITIAIIVVWRKMRRKKFFGQRLDSLSSNNSTQGEISS